MIFWLVWTNIKWVRMLNFYHNRLVKAKAAKLGSCDKHLYTARSRTRNNVDMCFKKS